MMTGHTTALVVRTDFESANEEEVNQWYNREHMRDRVVGIPGFIRGRRFIGLQEQPKYLAIYECHNGVLQSAPYERLSANPDEKTRRYVPLMRNMTRTVADISARFGEGEGSALAWISFTPEHGLEEKLRSFSGQLFASLAADGMVAGSLMEGGVSSAPTPGAADIPSLAQYVLPWTLGLEATGLNVFQNKLSLSTLCRLLKENGATGDVRSCGFSLLYRVSPP